MSTEHSIVNFLKSSGVQLRILDMGRRIEKISSDRFYKIEQGHIPYPHPYLHQAWIAVLLWNPKNKTQNAVWFLKLPLDEQGFLVQAARDDIMNRLLQNIQFAQGDLTESQDALKDNPFVFKPDQEKMAAFHAIANVHIGLEKSDHYREAKAYFSNTEGFSQWQNLNLQGIADFVIRIKESNNETLLEAAVPHLPIQSLAPTCVVMEHIVPNPALGNAIIARLDAHLDTEQTDSAIVAALLRGLSNIADETLKAQTLKRCLNHPIASSGEVLATVATRFVNSLRFPDVLSCYLEALATSEAGQAGFSRIMADLMFMPDIRALALQAFRNPARSEALGCAIGEMFGQNMQAH